MTVIGSLSTCPACGGVVVLDVAGAYDETHDEWNPDEYVCQRCHVRYYGDPVRWPEQVP